VVHGLSGADGAQLRGPDGFKPYFRAVRGALGDLRVDIKRVVTEGDICVAHCHVRARHTGESLGGPATGRPVDFWGMVMVKVRAAGGGLELFRVPLDVSATRVGERPGFAAVVGRQLEASLRGDRLQFT
jgi:hypothetical protein